MIGIINGIILYIYYTERESLAEKKNYSLYYIANQIIRNCLTFGKINQLNNIEVWNTNICLHFIEIHFF